MKSAIAAAFLSLAAAASAHAATQIVNLNASSSNPNAGNSSPGYPYNPVSLTLAAGSYAVKVAGVAGGGMYDAYAVYAPTATNGAYTDAAWSVSLNNGATAAYTQGSVGRFNTAAAAASAYTALSPYVFSLNTATTVSFYVDDTAYPYFADDVGGVSLSVSSVPEPASLALLGIGALGAAFGLRRRPSASAA